MVYLYPVPYFYDYAVYKYIMETKSFVADLSHTFIDTGKRYGLILYISIKGEFVLFCSRMFYLWKIRHKIDSE
jgi:hypothetical protein